MDDSAKPQTPIIDRNEYELACVREFSHSGAQLGPDVSREQRRERIRLAILREDKAHMRWRDTAHTYATVFEHVYARPIGGLPIEERRGPSRAWNPRSLDDGPYVVMANEVDAGEVDTDEMDTDEEEGDEVF
jgi:hypothetical protein